MPLPPPTALNVGRWGASIELSEVCSSVGQLEARAGEGLALAPLTAPPFQSKLKSFIYPLHTFLLGEKPLGHSFLQGLPLHLRASPNRKVERLALRTYAVPIAGHSLLKPFVSLRNLHS